MSKRKAHYCKRVADDICEQVALGLPLSRALIKVGPLAPSIAVFWKWLQIYPELKYSYEEALRFQANIHADKMLEIAIDAAAGKVKAPEARLAVDVYKWHAEMRDPAQYSPKGAQAVPPSPKSVKEMREEVARIQRELGIDVQPGMVTAPAILRKKQQANGAPESDTPAPTPNLKVVGGQDGE